jgi:hypothetical protein
VDVDEDGRRLGEGTVLRARVSLPSDRSLESFEQAVEHMSAPPIANSENVYANHVMVDALLEYAIDSEQARFSIRPRFDHFADRVVTVLRFVQPDGTARAYEFVGDPGVVAIDPHWGQAFGRFVQVGFFHILNGTDHLLFLLCLVIPFRKFRPLLMVVTAFTAAHSLTLAAAACNLAPDALWFPPLIEFLIAISIVYMALENILRTPGARARWMMAFGFGLVHGFGFAFSLRETLQFAGSHLLASFLAFNIGVELGQVLVLVVLIPVLGALFRYAKTERTGIVVISAVVAHTGWHWMLERADILHKYRFEWPEFNAGLWLALLALVAAPVWALSRRVLGRVPDQAISPQCSESEIRLEKSLKLAKDEIRIRP